MQSVQAVLFDLDNTLLLIDSEREFVNDYLKLVAAEFPDFSPELFIRRLVAATEVVIGDTDPDQTNAEVFFRHFCPALGLDPDETYNRLEEFYRTRYQALAGRCRPAPYARQVADCARETGLKTVLATNPVFPLVAIRRRLEWAGIPEKSFDFITALDHMHGCKPQPDYYLEIACSIGVEPERCLMIGNDPYDDGAARQVGMKVYLVDHGCWRQEGGFPVDYSGPLHEAVRLWGGTSAQLG